MLLTPQEADLFFKLHRSLMFYVNHRLHIIGGDVRSPEEFAALPPETRLGVREGLRDNMNLIDAFIDENPESLSGEELQLVKSWHHLVVGKFYVFRQLKKYMVFLSTTEPPVPYGVLALMDPFEGLVGPRLPVMTDTVLLPFGDKIVYDGILNSYRISFGAGIRRRLNDDYRTAKEQIGVVTSLPIQPATRLQRPRPATVRRPKRKPHNPFQGQWRIVSMDEWDDEFIHADGRGHLKFAADKAGSFHFGYVHCEIDYRVAERDGRPAVDFSFEGTDEMDPTSGRGWAVLDDERLHGVFFFHRGDESGFVARRARE